MYFKDFNALCLGTADSDVALKTSADAWMKTNETEKKNNLAKVEQWLAVDGSTRIQLLQLSPNIEVHDMRIPISPIFISSAIEFAHESRGTTWMCSCLLISILNCHFYLKHYIPLQSNPQI